MTSGPDLTSEPDPASGLDPASAGSRGAADMLAEGGWLGHGRRVTMLALLAAAMIAWAAAPLSGGRAGTRLALIAAVICALGSTGRLAIGEEPVESSPFDPPYLRLAASVGESLRAVPWAEGLIVAVLALEALHASRPWHTAVLGLALLAYVLAAHLAQARTGPAALAGQLPVLAAGIGLLALSVGAAALPGLHAGPGTELLRILAVLAAVAAAGLALPAGGRRDPADRNADRPGS